MSKGDAERIEEHTGVPPEDLEDGDLDTAMQELDIADEPVTATEE